jgi:FkbM family methyltransferase
MIIQENIFRKKLRSLALRLLCYVESNSNTNFDRNGERVFVNHLFNLLKDKSEKIVLFDVGANVGDYTQILLEQTIKLQNECVEIHVFEPTQKCFQIINKRFHYFPQIILNQKAISDKKGKAEIFYNEAASGLSSLYQRDLRSVGVSLNQSEAIETTTLRIYIEDNGIEHISFLKLDVEGHEVKALQSLGKYLHKDFIDFIQFEYGGTSLDSHTNLKDFYDLLKEDYAIAKVMPKGLEIRTYQSWMDNFQYANYVAISKRYLEKL